MKYYTYQGRLYNVSHGRVTFYCSWNHFWLPCAVTEEVLIDKGQRF